MIAATSEAGAILSPCGIYRYRLWRHWDPELPTLCWIMLNPSTADAVENDPTIRKCIGFAKRYGFGGIDVVNLYGYRATDPRSLRYTDDPIGPDNDRTVLGACRSAARGYGRIVCAWGAHAKDKNRVTAVLDMLDNAGLSYSTLRLNSNGSPAHPLMLPYSCELSDWYGELA